MRRNKVIIISLLLIGYTLVAIVIVKVFAMLPQKAGIIIVNDGPAISEEPIATKEDNDNADNSLVTGEPDSSGDTSTDEAGGLPTNNPSAVTSDTSIDITTDTSSDTIPDTSSDISSNSSPYTSTDTITEDDTMTGNVQGGSQMFYYEAISQEIKDRITGISYAENCDVPYEELCYVKVLYWDFEGETQIGELIVNKAIAEDITQIFKELYEQRYPIERMVLIDEYEADDNASMAADNTSAFNYRTVDDGSGRLSNHSYGLAIDINPRYNPYVRKVDGETVISPENGVEYADRSLDCEYYIKEGDACYQAFTSRGFTWGGAWKNQKDYQHFQKKID